jgi:methylated-DNA-[protein]-cysteine S-methyltransferase
MARNPWPIIVPCHRVIGSRGQLTGFGGGLKMKHRLLEMEAVERISDSLIRRLADSQGASCRSELTPG